MTIDTGLPKLKDGVSFASHLFLIMFLALIAGAGYWAWSGNLAVVSVAEGEVVPSSQIKSIQHLEGGIVRAIRIAEGDQVKAGQALIVLESTASGADVDELRTRIAGLSIEIARLTAEQQGDAAPTFDAATAAQRPDLVRDALALFTKRRARLEDARAGQRAIINQRRQDAREISARIGASAKMLKLMREQVNISESLLKDALTNRYKHIELLKETARLQGAIAQDRVAAERAKSARIEAVADLTGIGSKFSEEAAEDLDAARRQLAEFTPRLAKFEDSLKRTILRAPVDGVVKTLHVVTVGGVVKPGDVVLDIVPGGDRLIIEARLATQDIGFVRAGQEATVRLTATDAMRFDNLTGEVVAVSPDTLTAEDGRPFYRVRIATKRDHFLRGAVRYDLFPGMEVSTSIHTGERTVMEYLLDSFLSARGEALRER